VALPIDGNGPGVLWHWLLGVRLAYSADSVTLIWPPAGIALAAGLPLGYRVWPGILLGEAAVLTVRHLPLPVICSAATGNALGHAQAGTVLLGCRRRGANLRIEVWDNGK